jgi:hypothetical protein
MACQQLLLLGCAAVGLVLLVAHETACRTNTGGILYPQESESRDVRSLDGIWNFRLSPETDPLTGFRDRWFQKDLSQVGLCLFNTDLGQFGLIKINRNIFWEIRFCKADRTKDVILNYLSS